MMAELAALYAERLDRPEDALKLARNAHDLDGEDPEVCSVLGRLSYQHGDYTYALTLLQKAANTDQAEPRAFSDLALAYYAVGKAADATAAMQAALSRGLAGPEREAGELFLTLTQAAASPATAKGALATAKTALQHDPRNAPALMVCAIAAQGAGDDKAAAAYYETVAAAYPPNGACPLATGLALVRASWR